MKIMRVVGFEELRNNNPYFVESCNQATLRNIITAFNAVINQNRFSLYDMSQLQSEIVRYSRQKRTHLSDGPGTRGLLHCIVAYSISHEIPEAARWINHVEESMSKLALTSSWPAIKRGYRKMLHGNSIVSMAVEAHIGAALSNFGNGLKMHLNGMGDVTFLLDGIQICMEIKTRSGRYSNVASIHTSGLLDGDLDHPIIIREKRDAASEEEVIEYAKEVLEQYRKALDDIGDQIVEANPKYVYWRHVKDCKYIHRIGIYPFLYRKGQGGILEIDSDDSNVPVDRRIRDWMVARIYEASSQMQPRSDSRLNIITLMLPPDDFPLILVDNDLAGFLGEPIQRKNIDAIIIGEFRSIENERSSIGYACRFFKTSPEVANHEDLLRSICDVIRQRT